MSIMKKILAAWKKFKRCKKKKKKERKGKNEENMISGICYEQEENTVLCCCPPPLSTGTRQRGWLASASSVRTAPPRSLQHHALLVSPSPQTVRLGLHGGPLLILYPAPSSEHPAGFLAVTLSHCMISRLP